MVSNVKSKSHKTRVCMSELLILPDGKILVHNLSQPFAELLRKLNPDDEHISPRVKTNVRQGPHLSPSKNQNQKQA